MTETHYKVEVEKDHITKLSGARPVPAVAELIWNSLDADATKVHVSTESDEVAMRAVVVRDNGHGIPREEVETLFSKLGGSWKRLGSRSKTKGRLLHGKEGKGRFKALALGRVAEWTVTYAENNKRLRYQITIIRDDLTDVRATDAVEVASDTPTGVEVRVTELERTFRSLTSEFATQELTENFALYLTDYSGISVFFDGKALDPSDAIAAQHTVPLSPITDEGIEYQAEVVLIEWKHANERSIFLCGEEGFPFHRVAPRFQSSGYPFSAYLKSKFIGHLQQKGMLELVEMSGALEGALNEAADHIKSHFREKHAEAARSEIEEWKAAEIYPYKEEPQTSVETAERKVFDIVALNVKRQLRDFSDSSKQTKAFQLRMLRQAIESGPDELQKILTEVLDLPERKQRELAKLLEEADLAHIISASKLVADRLKFLSGIEALLFDDGYKEHLKERSQLHRLLADNTWVFGEAFNLTVDDQSLTQVLRKHRKAIGDEIAIDRPVKRQDGRTGIIDLMLSQSVPRNHANEREYLVVELKRPTVPIGGTEIAQIESYADAVAGDERFRSLDTRWHFWVISNELDDFAKRKAAQKDRPFGQISWIDDGNIAIWVKSWAQVLSEAKARMQFVQNELQATIDKDSSLRYLRQTYEKYLAGDDEEESEGDAQDSLSAKT